MNNSKSPPTANPGPLLEEIYRSIQREHMLGLPILNPELHVEAVGFTPFNGLWVGVLITPWFMNLMLLSGTTPCPALAAGGSQYWSFPGGPLQFSAGIESEVGPCQVSSLFSPMHEFADQQAARAAAQAAVDELLGETAAPVPPPPANERAQMHATVDKPMSKRDFLRSFLPGRRHAPRRG